MRVLVIQNCEGERIGSYAQYLIEKEIDYHTLRAYRNEPFPPIEDFNGFIATGAPISAYKAHEHPFVLRECEYITDIIKSGKPYLGICFGGQLLAKVLGAEVRKNPVKEIGTYSVQLTEDGRRDRLFAEFPDEFSVFHWHGDTFDIPPKAKLLAIGSECRNQAFRYQNSIALQFHLEASSRDVSGWCDEYASELAEAGKTKAHVVGECRKIDGEMKKLGCVLLGNLLC